MGMGQLQMGMGQLQMEMGQLQMVMRQLQKSRDKIKQMLAKTLNPEIAKVLLSP